MQISLLPHIIFNFSQCTNLKTIFYIYNTTLNTIQSLRKVISQHGKNTAFYVASPTAIQQQITTWKSALPSIRPYYAVKSNPDVQIMKWLELGGVRFDCASGREIRDVLSPSVGGTSENIIYANPHKTVADCHLASEVGVKKTVVDSPEEVEKIAHTGWRPDILVRLAVNDTASRSPFSIKFGAERWAWMQILSAIQKHGLIFGGVSFHVGSASGDPSQYRRAIETCRDFVVETGQHAECVDIGGGFVPETFAESSRVIRRAIADWYAKSPMSAPSQWIAEPGRFFSSRSHTLYAPIIGRKRGPGGVGWRYILDESVYGQFSCIPFDHARPHWLVVGGQSEGGDCGKRGKEKGFLFGRTCDSIDLIAYSEKMPVMNEGDWLCFPEMGAYTTASSSEFNGYPKPMTYYQDSGWVESAPVNSDIVFPIEAKSSIELSTTGRSDDGTMG
jgi:ornithine decarboxylase